MIKKTLIYSLCLWFGLLAACTTATSNPATATAKTKQPTKTTSTKQGWLSQLLHPNLWKTMDKDHALSYNPEQIEIKKQIEFYTKNKTYINHLTNNATPYIYYIYQQTHKRNMPAEIALLPMVESNYSPFLYSKQGATGLWQIMPGTASGFHLDINWWYDGRRDTEASTTAALDYLDYLHNYFNDWLLAIAAYNCGEGTVQQAIRHNKKLNKPTTFWALSLPYQTKTYVPKLLALATIMHNPQQYSVTLPNIPNKPYFKSIPMSGQIDFSLIATLADMPTQDIRLLNPGFRRFATSPDKDYAILLPVDKAEIFTNNLNDNTEKRVNWSHHIVQSGDTLSEIADTYKTKTSILMRVNNLSSNIIHPKQNLLIPLTNNTSFHANIKTQQGNIAEDHIPGPQRTIYIVQAGDTLNSIARHYGVRTSAIEFWNNLSSARPIHEHDSLIIWLSKPIYKQPTPTIYKVKAGDSLSAIANHNHTSVAKLKQSNNLKNNTIKIGQTLKIIANTNQVAIKHFSPKSKNEMIIHTVSPGENLSVIAHHYHVSVNQLNSWNNLHNKTQIKIGQKISIYPKKA